MADIILSVPDIDGESRKSGYTNKIDCSILRETLEVQRGGSTRRARHSDIELTKERDRATPKLAHACSAGTVLGTCFIYVLNTQGTPLMTYELRETVVSKVDHETLDANGTAYLPHSPAGTAAPPNATSPNPVVGAGALAGQVLPTGGQLMPRAYITNGFSAPGNVEVERIWLNAEVVAWTHTAAGSNIQRAWNILTGAVPTA